MTLPAGCGHVSPNTTPRKRPCEPWGDGCDAAGVRWPITPIKTASFARQVLRRSPNNSGEKAGRAPSSDGHLANCGSNGSRHKVRRRKGASSDCSRPSRTAWGRKCVWREYLASKLGITFLKRAFFPGGEG